MGAKEASILAAVGAEKVEDIDLDKLEILIGLGTSIKDGEVSLEEAFPGAPKNEGRPVFQEPAKIEAPKPPLTVTTPAPEPVQEPAAAPTAVVAEVKVEEPAGTPQERLAALVTGSGFAFDQFAEWLVAVGFVTEKPAAFADVSNEIAARLVKSPRGMIAQLKGGAK